ncbi:DPP IV N-terminal domain-containing protein [candidate division KSB1 bacterium]|nr:DPP IV N-terminal domain-containing protein [candidate division KSB1 bacterium]
MAESWIVDLHGNVIKKIAEGEASWASFSPTGDYFVFSVNGNIWLDYLPY